MPIIDTPRMTFHYRSHGDPEGLPMLLLHGSFASSRWWVPFMDLLPNEILAIAPDLRGCGQSERTGDESAYAITEQAADLHAFVEAMDLRGFDLVAHSSAAAIAVEYTLTHPDGPATLTLVDPVPVEGIFTPVDGVMALEQMKTDRALLEQGLIAMAPTFPRERTPGNEADADFFAQLVEDAAGQAPAAFTATATALNQWNRFADAQALTLPAVIIWGDQDALVNRDAVTRTLIAIPGVNNLEVMRGVGHSPLIETPLRLAELIIDFVTQDYAAYGQIRGQAEEGDMEDGIRLEDV
jgi:branched-chain amino acid transport system permease protein